MPFGIAALIFVAVVTVTLIIVTNKKRSAKIRVTAGIAGGLISLAAAGYLLLTIIFFGAV
jgi:hypothetical protein